MSDQDKPFNKAQQLKPILESATLANQETVARQVLGDIFRINPKNDDLLQSRLKQTRKLIREVQREVKRVPEIDYNLYLTWVPNALEHVYSLKLR